MLPAPVRVVDRLAENAPAECHRPDDGENHHDDQPDIFFFHYSLTFLDHFDFFWFSVPINFEQKSRMYTSKVIAKVSWQQRLPPVLIPLVPFRDGSLWFGPRPQRGFQPSENATTTALDWCIQCHPRDEEFWSRSRLAKQLTTGIWAIFRGSNVEHNVDIEQNGRFWVGLAILL